MFLFVYGTLKQDFSNNYVLKNLDALYISKVQTLLKFPLIIDRDPFPYLFDFSGKGKNIDGELFKISSSVLKEIDEFEGVPSLYHRGTIDVIDNKGKKYFDVVCYFATDTSLLKDNSKLLSNFSIENYWFSNK
jgi:gamma-glutamylcyclotransferase (GGCT)/AIG2-like uncharacterized protein YtfP